MSAATEASVVAGPVAAAAGSAQPDNRPVVVLSYQFAGAERLTEALSASSSLACTQGTGLIPLCHAALACWQKADDRAGPPSALAIKTVRALAGTMVTAIQARTGAARWCETALAQPAAASSFLQVFPSASFVCVHRDVAGVLADGLRAYPWGLGGSPFWSHSAGHPGNNVATIAAYWAISSESLLNFEAEHPASCLRVRYEDLASGFDAAATRLFSYLRLDARDVAEMRRKIATAGGFAVARASGEIEMTAPAELIPSDLLRRVNLIQAKLEYEGLARRQPYSRDT